MSSTMDEIELGETISLVLKIKGRIPTDAKFQKQGRVSYNVAKNFSDVDGIHASNLTYLPEGTPKSASLLNYTLLTSIADGSNTAIADDWVESFTRHDTEDYDLRMTSISTKEYQDLIKILNNYGFNGRYQLIVRSNPS